MTHADSIWAKALELHSDSLHNKVDSLQAKLDALQGKTELLSNVIETANDGVSNQLASATFWLEVIAILIVIVGGVIGYYINYRKKQIEEIASLVEEKKHSVEKMASETERLDASINHNLKNVYIKLRKEETDVILDRLIQEPYDISNLEELLLSREIGKDNFPKLREAYLKFVREEEELSPEVQNTYNTMRYVILFFQHFFYDSIRDDSIREILVKYFDEACTAAFKRDIINSTIELCRALSNETSTFNKEDVLVNYLKAIDKSKHKTFMDLKNIFEQNLVPQTLLQRAIKRCKKEKVYLQLFNVSQSEDEISHNS